MDANVVGPKSVSKIATGRLKGHPDAVFIVALGTVSVTPQRDLVASGYKGMIYQSGAAATPDFVRVAGKAAEGTYLVQVPVLVADQLPEGYPTKKAALQFESLYKAKYGTTSFFGATMWDGRTWSLTHWPWP